MFFRFLAVVWCECKAGQAQAKCSRLYILNVMHLNIRYCKYGGILKAYKHVSCLIYEPPLCALEIVEHVR